MIQPDYYWATEEEEEVDRFEQLEAINFSLTDNLTEEELEEYEELLAQRL